MKVVKHKVKFINKYPTDIDIYSEIPVTVLIDEFAFDPIPAGTKRIVMLEEPLKGDLFYLARDHQDLYDVLLTYQQELLDVVPKARLFRCADTWVHGYRSEEKRFAVSTVVGGKSDPRMPGYAVRHELWERRDEITIPKEFYLSKNYKWSGANYSGELVLGESKTPLFDCMFHVSIENTSIEHYFSEKLLDCFQTFTVPIYYGCKNVGDYFNINGLFVVDVVDEIVRICNNMTPAIYESMIPAMNDNYERAQARINYFDQLKDKIIEVLESL